MNRQIRFAMWCLTSVAWLLLVLATTPAGDSLSEADMRLTIGVAAVGTIATLIGRSHPGADELYRLGKSVGRAEVLAEIAAGNVVRLADRPALRVVADEEAERDQA